LALHYRELVAWQKAVGLVTDIYKITSDFPSREKFGLVSQLRRAAVSIPSNIAEGQGRASTGEFKQFLGHARGSLFELSTQILIAKNLAFINESSAAKLDEQINEVGRLISGLIRALKAKQEDTKN
jgi:four helix bundle protein